ncbi:MULTISPECIES: hypothetical protein [unclassified Streptomyces]|uniref:hypothetical protein n=1 Tax=unclassified Streptomyces TaxID=2593676 RepID=UPI00164FEDD4|nr:MULTISPECIES: hypothetical protein [unclassified Streptomyces]MDX3684667.1 hypothetical protein [Streptomyces sp. AK04-4c]
MVPAAPTRPRIQSLTTAGTALAVTLLPLAAGVLLARTMALDPMAPLNALVTSGGQRARLAPSRWMLKARTRELLSRR